MQYVTDRGETKYKEFNEEDRERVEEAEEILEREWDDLPIPTQEILSGDKTSRLTARSYESYDQLFSSRQLLTYAKLFERVAEVENDNISEFLITAISNSIERGSTLTKWDHYYNISGHVFERQSYIPRVEPVEGIPSTPSRILLRLRTSSIR